MDDCKSSEGECQPLKRYGIRSAESNYRVTSSMREK